jgi:hypothetical protein
MILNDKVYKLTKKIREGKSQIAPNLKPLANWINATYNVNVLNVVVDKIQNSNRPRIQVIVEFANDLSKFTGEGMYGYSDKARNEIIEKYKSLDKGIKPSSWKNISNFFRISKSTINNDIWVIFFDFQTVAKQEIGENITNAEIKNLKTKISDNNLWEISKDFTIPTFFLYTDEQVKEYEKNGKQKTWSKMYYPLMQQHDKFGYIKEEYFNIYLDSKQNFDENYESNWYYYYK